MLPGIRSTTHLDDIFKDQIMRSERQAEEAGALGGLIPINNEGFWSVMEREEQYALLFDGGSGVINMASDLLQLKDEEDNLIGEWIPARRVEELKGAEGVQFISDDFVLYSDVPLTGTARLILPEVDFPFLEGIEGITDLTSASPSSLTNEIIKSNLDMNESNLLSHIIGFNVEVDPGPMIITGRRRLH